MICILLSYLHKDQLCSKQLKLIGNCWLRTSCKTQWGRCYRLGISQVKKLERRGCLRDLLTGIITQWLFGDWKPPGNPIPHPHPPATDRPRSIAGRWAEPVVLTQAPRVPVPMRGHLRAFQKLSRLLC